MQIIKSYKSFLLFNIIFGVDVAVLFSSPCLFSISPLWFADNDAISPVLYPNNQ